MRQRPVRTAAAISTVVVSIFYLLAQMVGAGALVALLLGIDRTSRAEELGDRPVGALMIIYVTVGGMKGTTWVQIVKAVLLMAGAILMTFLVLLHFNFNLSELLGAAADKSGKGRAFLEPGLQVRRRPTDQQDRLPVARHRAGARHGRLPHILIRFYTVPTAKDRPQVGALGDRPHRHLLPDDAGARLRRGGAGRSGPDSEVAQAPATRRRRCWPRRSAAARQRSAARCCWR